MAASRSRSPKAGTVAATAAAGATASSACASGSRSTAASSKRDPGRRVVTHSGRACPCKAEAMEERPSGTVTFLFTDIEGSTVLLRQLRDAYGDVLATHGRLLRQAFEGAGGQEIDTQGDSFFVAFSSPKDAVHAAVAAQRSLADEPWPEGAVVRVRMGIHKIGRASCRERVEMLGAGG